MMCGMAWCEFSATLVPLKEIENLVNGILPKNRRWDWKFQRVFPWWWWGYFIYIHESRPTRNLPTYFEISSQKIEVNDFSLLLKQWVDFKTASQCGCNNPFGMRSGQTTYHNTTHQTDGRTKTPEIVITNKWGKKCGAHLELFMLNAAIFSSTHFFSVIIKERVDIDWCVLLLLRVITG